MTTRSYRLTIDAVIGTDRELDRIERQRLRGLLTVYLNRNFRLNMAVDQATNGSARINGPAHFRLGSRP